MDGIEWKEARRKMDQLLLKKECCEKYALPWSFKVTDLLMKEWLNQLDKHINEANEDVDNLKIKDLEMTMHKWSVESILASLFGASFFSLGKTIIVMD